MTFDIEKWRQTHVLYPQTTFRCASGEGAGDCIRASIATLLQIDPTTLTNWMELPDGEWDARMTADLRALGYEIASVTVDAAREVWGALEPQGPVLLAGLTAKGQPHCTVGLLDGTLLHDPLGNGGCPTIDQIWLIAPCDDVQWTDDGVLVALDALKRLP